MYTSFKISKNLNTLTYLTLSAALFYSCSQRVAQVAVAPKAIQADTTTVAVVLPGNAVRIDSIAFNKAGAATLAKAAQFYRQHGYQSQWLFDTKPSPLFAALEATLSDAGKFGLRASDYDLQGIQEKVKILYSEKAVDAKALATLDVYITEMLFHFTTHLSTGKITEVMSGRSIWMPGQRVQKSADVALISKVQTPADLTAAIQQLQPANAQYGKLQQALAYYRALEKNTPAAIDIVKGTKVKQDDHNAIIPSVRKKLSITDMRPYAMTLDSTTGTFDSLRYDATLVDAVKTFQAKHGLEPDGIIGEKTLRFMNQSFKDKADVIALNMERMRWSTEKYGDNYIFVNVPAYTLTVYENRQPAMQMRVIVGAVDKPTPIFSDALEYIVFSPTWTVPTSIIKEEIIPRLKSNTAYYADKNYAFYKDEVPIDPTTEVWDDTANPYKYRIVQQPGPDNSLGLVKFIMPNNMSVYLHDTPNHRLFTKDYRALSHGCVRVDEPAKLAAYLMRDQKGWDTKRIQEAMHATQPATIHLKKKLDVHIEYITAWVDENDTINFREDIYGHDKRQLQQLYPKDKAGAIAGL